MGLDLSLVLVHYALYLKKNQNFNLKLNQRELRRLSGLTGLCTCYPCLYPYTSPKVQVFLPSFCSKHPWLFGGYVAIFWVLLLSSKVQDSLPNVSVCKSVTYPKLSEGYPGSYPVVGGLQDMSRDMCVDACGYDG
jgi:hypothetical protein